jgi:hypothetical protein
MPVAVTAVLFIFWIALAFRRFQQGDMMMAGIFALVGVVLTIHRLRTKPAS